jgi:hypothetical protein
LRSSVAILLLSFCCRVSHTQERPVFSLTSGWIYVSAAQPVGGRAAFNGWYVIPQYHLNNNWSIIAESDNLYGSPRGVSTNQHVYIAGPLYGRNVGKRLYPFVFSEVGAIRISAAGDITHSFILVAGPGLNISLNKRVALQLLPADFVLANLPTGVVLNYAAQAGMVFHLWTK